MHAGRLKARDDLGPAGAVCPRPMHQHHVARFHRLGGLRRRPRCEERRRKHADGGHRQFPECLHLPNSVIAHSGRACRSSMSFERHGLLTTSCQEARYKRDRPRRNIGRCAGESRFALPRFPSCRLRSARLSGDFPGIRFQASRPAVFDALRIFRRRPCPCVRNCGARARRGFRSLGNEIDIDLGGGVRPRIETMRGLGPKTDRTRRAMR
jgi:hypothetical protein